MFYQRISQLHKILTYDPNMWNTYVLTVIKLWLVNQSLSEYNHNVNYIKQITPISWHNLVRTQAERERERESWRWVTIQTQFLNLIQWSVEMAVIVIPKTPISRFLQFYYLFFSYIFLSSNLSFFFFFLRTIF